LRPFFHRRSATENDSRSGRGRETFLCPKIPSESFRASESPFASCIRWVTPVLRRARGGMGERPCCPRAVGAAENLEADAQAWPETSWGPTRGPKRGYFTLQCCNVCSPIRDDSPREFGFSCPDQRSSPARRGPRINALIGPILAMRELETTGERGDASAKLVRCAR